MDVRRITVPAIRQLNLDLDQLEQQANVEIREPHTRSLGTLRLDLVEECRRRLWFFGCMLEDSEQHASERHRGHGSK
jgi:hypothetical protein